MAWMDLPVRAGGAEPSFDDAESARRWLAGLPADEAPGRMDLLRASVEAVDASAMAPENRLAVLAVLRDAVAALQPDCEPRYARKALPLAAAEAAAFAAVAGAWRALAVACLRLLPYLAPPLAASALAQSAMALRREQHACFLAAQEVPRECLRLLYGALSAAEARGILRAPVADPERRPGAETDVAGQAAWAFLLHFADCHALTAAQLAVTNRIFGRWCGLVAFQGVPGDGGKACVLPLGPLAGEQGAAAGGVAWMDVRPVLRKMEKRIASLAAGESPEKLKLGRELSAEACVALLKRLDRALRQRQPLGGNGEMRLAFGAEDCYAAIAGRLLNPPPRLDRGRHDPVYERIAIFGFAQPAPQRPEVPAEIWRAADGWLERAADEPLRRQAPCLVACLGEGDGAPTLGMLTALHATADGRLRGRIDWFGEGTRAVWFRNEVGGRNSAAFFVPGEKGWSVLLGATPALRLGSRLQMEDGDIRLLTLEKVIERGSDFVRYAFEQQ